MDSSLTKGVMNFPPSYMPKHVSGDTYVDQTAQEKTVGRVFLHGVVAIFANSRHTFQFGRWMGFMTIINQ
jgi:hypothetical protein